MSTLNAAVVLSMRRTLIRPRAVHLQGSVRFRAGLAVQSALLILSNELLP